MGKKSFSREAAEVKEGLDTVKNDVPENRLQGDQQVQNTDAAIKTKAEDSSWQAKKVNGKGSELKQQKVADVITGSVESAGMGISAAGRGVSGTVGGILGASNSTPEAGKSRSRERVGKKLDRTATKLNYTPCERALLSMDESKPLADAANEGMGYNGTYRNEDARSQKIMGATPADLMFQRSVDYIMKDKLYFVEGQMVYQSGNADRYAANPSISVNPDTGLEENVKYKSGNYVHKQARYVIDENGKVAACAFDVDDLDCDTQTPEDANMASAHRLIKENVAELDRISMDAKAGDEKADIWTPLARAIPEPTKASYLMSSIEAETGAYVHLAYSKATTCMSHQLNRGVKDGLDPITPAIENVVGWRTSVKKEADIKTAYSGSLQTCFDKAYYRKGDPSLMIALYDSTGKYNNKADLLLQPRGYRMHLQTADNNINPLRVPKEYINVYTGQETYSTIDHEYDPLLPICFTDKANLITVHNFNELGGFFKNDYSFHLTYDTTSGYTEAKKVLIATPEIVRDLGYETLHLYQKYDEGEGLTLSNGLVAIKADSPIGSETANINLLILPAALSEDDLDEGGAYYGYALLGTYDATDPYDLCFKKPKIEVNKITAFNYSVGESRVFAKDARPYSYAYSDLRNNYIVEVKHPFIEGLIEYINNSIGGKLSSDKCLDSQEFNLPLVFSTQYMTLAQLFICAATPWISRVRLNSMKDVLYYEDNVHEYPYSKLISIKESPFKNYVNFNFNGYDEPIDCKVMNPSVAMQWIMPEFFWKVDSHKYVLPWYFNEVDLNTDGTVDEDAANMSMPSIRSGIRSGLLDSFYGLSENDIRLSLDRISKGFLKNVKFSAFKAYKYGRTTDGQIMVDLNDQNITMADYLVAPRELGLVLDAPLGYLTKDPYAYDDWATLTSDGTIPSYRIRIYVNPKTQDDPSILAASGVNIDRGSNYVQTWLELTCSDSETTTQLAGLVFGMNDQASYGQMSPFADLGTGAQASSQPTLQTCHKALWTRLQTLPFVISPFDSHTNLVYGADIFDLAYVFGLAGFRASDYRELVYNREKEVVNQGLLFVEDPWVIDSPIIKYAGKSTGQSITKGYEI